MVEGSEDLTSEFSGFRTRDAGDDGAFSPHILAEIDKVHAKGITGKGVKVAIIDSGVGSPRSESGGPCWLLTHDSYRLKRHYTYK